VRERSDVTQRACCVLGRERVRWFETQCYLDIVKMASVVQEHEMQSQCFVV
jgi:hypothetical protein